MSLTGIRDLTLLNTAAGRAPADPHLRRPLRRAGGGRVPAAGAAAGGPGVLRPQPGAGHRAGGGPPGRAGARGPHRGRPRPDGRGPSSSGSVLDFWEGQYDVLVCTTIIESGIDMPTVNTLVVDRADLMGLGQLHQLRGRVGRAGQRAYAYLFFPPERSAVRGGLRAAEDDRRAHRAGVGVQDRHARPGDPRRRQPARRRASRGHIAAVGYDLYVPDGERGGGRAEGRAGAGAGRDQASTCPSTPTCRRTTSPAASCGSRPTGGWRWSPPRPRSTTSGPSGSTATGRCRRRPRRCSPWPRSGPSASRIGVREVTVGPGGRPASRPIELRHQPAGPAPAAGQGRRLQGGDRPAVRPAAPGRRSGRPRVVDLLRALVPAEAAPVASAAP